jgi:hypothetical protein
MDFRCKFVIKADFIEISLFETIKERIMEELSWDINGLDYMEFEEREYSDVYVGMVRVPVVFKFHTSTQEEATTLYDIYTWVGSMISRYGRNFGIDEISVNGSQIDISDSYRVPQLMTVL